jgi:hypothetical protein
MGVDCVDWILPAVTSFEHGNGTSGSMEKYKYFESPSPYVAINVSVKVFF